MAVSYEVESTDIKAFLDEFADVVKEVEKEALAKVCTESVNIAKTIPPSQGFHDVTGNLRSSMGYVLFEDGKPIDELYEVVSGINDSGESYSGDEGVKKGKDYALEKGRETKGVTGVVTAGMPYAKYVEAKGRDVLTSAENYAKRRVTELGEEIAEDIRSVMQTKKK